MILKGMEGYLTDLGAALIKQYIQENGLTYDIAHALLDIQIDKGIYKEADIYDLPPKSEE